MTHRPPIAFRSKIAAMFVVALVAGWLWRLHPWTAGPVVGLAVAVCAGALRRVVLRRSRGYWVEYVSPSALRGEADEFGVVYHEGEHEIWLTGRERPAPSRWDLAVPDEEAWAEGVGPWAAARRAEILGRVRADSLVARRCELTTQRAA